MRQYLRDCLCWDMSGHLYERESAVVRECGTTDHFCAVLCGDFINQYGLVFRTRVNFSKSLSHEAARIV
ncbi:MAG: hypothetical protein ACLSEY_12175 [Enterocloster sp.]